MWKSKLFRSREFNISRTYSWKQTRSLSATADAIAKRLERNIHIFLRRSSREANLKDANGLSVLFFAGCPDCCSRTAIYERYPRVMSRRVTDPRESFSLPAAPLRSIRSLQIRIWISRNERLAVIDRRTFHDRYSRNRRDWSNGSTFLQQ